MAAPGNRLLASMGSRDQRALEHGSQEGRHPGQRRPVGDLPVDAAVEELAEGVEARLDEMLLCGTTTAEVKSGYGLETAAEIRSLEAIHLAASRHPVTVVPTFLGAHEVPLGYRNRRADYVELVVQEMIPAVDQQGIAEFGDVFCEEGVFTVEESRRILLATREHGMKLRIHADELVWTGGAELAAELGARSADHLGFISEAGMEALAAASCVATLLPSATFYLRLGHYAPARSIVESGAPVALASDINPGGGLSPSLPFAMSIGCFAMGLALEEALVWARKLAESAPDDPRVGRLGADLEREIAARGGASRRREES